MPARRGGLGRAVRRPSRATLALARWPGALRPWPKPEARDAGGSWSARAACCSVRAAGRLGPRGIVPHDTPPCSSARSRAAAHALRWHRCACRLRAERIRAPQPHRRRPCLHRARTRKLARTRLYCAVLCLYCAVLCLYCARIVHMRDFAYSRTIREIAHARKPPGQAHTFPRPGPGTLPSFASDP